MPPSRSIRGLQDIRTHSDKLGRGNQGYQLYLRLGCLEMEAERRKKERESAAERLRKIDSRLAAIEKEKQSLRRAAGFGSPKKRPKSKKASDEQGASQGPSSVKIQY